MVPTENGDRDHTVAGPICMSWKKLLDGECAHIDALIRLEAEGGPLPEEDIPVSPLTAPDASVGGQAGVAGEQVHEKPTRFRALTQIELSSTLASSLDRNPPKKQKLRGHAVLTSQEFVEK